MSLIKVVAILARPTIAAVDWVPLIVAATTSWGWAVVAYLSNPDPLSRTMNLTITLRISAVLLSAAAGFAIVDRMTPTVAATPVPRWLRQWLRTAIAIGAAASAWLTVLVLSQLWVPPGHALPPAGFLVEAATCLFVALASAASAVRRRSDRAAGVYGATLFFFLIAGTLFLSGPAWPWPWPADPQWSAVHRMWLVALPIPVLVLGLAHRDIRTR